MRRPTLIVLAAGGLLAAGCGGDVDFQDGTEDFIEDDDGELAETLGGTFDDATCDEPASEEVGTSFTCTATDASGATVTFLATIEGDDRVAVGLDPGGATPPAATGSVPPTSATGSTPPSSGG